MYRLLLLFYFNLFLFHFISKGEIDLNGGDQSPSDVNYAQGIIKFVQKVTYTSQATCNNDAIDQLHRSKSKPGSSQQPLK